MPDADLPLRYVTPSVWAAQALRDPLALLNDHAHLEEKAATNALELLNRWPEPNPPENWVTAMTAIARDEVEHLAVVTRLLARRGGKLTKSHSNAYASELHKLVRKGLGREELIDRLMISALIEARSCERFNLLGRHVSTTRSSASFIAACGRASTGITARSSNWQNNSCRRTSCRNAGMKCWTLKQS